MFPDPDSVAAEVEGAAESTPAFRILRTMVTNWLTDAVDHGNKFADGLLRQLYRWVCSPQSSLHDPKLRTLLLSTMQKVSQHHAEGESAPCRR
jgi:hypothetical protein